MITANHLAPKRNDAPTSFGNAGSLDAIFNPRTVAIIGANEQPGTMGQKALSAVMNSEFRGSTFVVQPEQSSVRGVNPPSYEAIRTHNALYVEYADGDKEYHDLAADLYELHNIFSSPSSEQKSALHAAIEAMQNCHGTESCWSAQHLKPRATHRIQP